MRAKLAGLLVLCAASFFIGFGAHLKQPGIHRGLAVPPPRDHGVRREAEGLEDLALASLFLA